MWLLGNGRFVTFTFDPLSEFDALGWDIETFSSNGGTEHIAKCLFFALVHFQNF